MRESQKNADIRQKLIDIFLSCKGKSKVIVKSLEDGSLKPFPSKYSVKINDHIVHELENILGFDSVVVLKNANEVAFL